MFYSSVFFSITFHSCFSLNLCRVRRNGYWKADSLVAEACVVWRSVSSIFFHQTSASFIWASYFVLWSWWIITVFTFVMLFWHFRLLLYLLTVFQAVKSSLQVVSCAEASSRLVVLFILPFPVPLLYLLRWGQRAEQLVPQTRYCGWMTGKEGGTGEGFWGWAQAGPS